MQESTIIETTPSGQLPDLESAAHRAERWSSEPFLHPGEDPEVALAPGTARRFALDDALEEIEAGHRTPSPGWKVRYGLMLGLERVLAAETPATASGTALRRHQIDALTGMLTELIAATQRSAEENGNGSANGSVAELVEEDEDEEDVDLADEAEETDEPGFTGDDPGASRRYRFRHPTASGKTIAAAGFVESARHLGVLILTHRRLLVDQFRRDLTTEGYGERLTDAIEAGTEPLRADPLTIQTYAWFARHGNELSRTAYQLVICDEAHTALGEKTSTAIRSFSEPLYIGMTATEQLIAKQVSDVFPASATRPASTTRTTSRRSSAPPVSRRWPSPAGRRRASWPRPSPPMSAERSTCSSTRSSWPRAGTHHARPCACISPRPRRSASTSSGSGGSCGRTRARRPGSSSTSSRRVRPTRSGSSPSTPCSTLTSTAREPASRPPPVAARRAAPAGSFPRRPGSSRSRRTSAAGSR